MQINLEEAQEGVEQAVHLARNAQIHAENESSESKEQALYWKSLYLKERETSERLKSQLEQSNESKSSCIRLPAKQSSRSSFRRHTVPTDSASEPSKDELQSKTSSGINMSSLAAYLLLQGEKFRLGRPSSRTLSSSRLGQGTTAHPDNNECTHDCNENHVENSPIDTNENTTISVADYGHSGVGAAAAAAISVALAQSWAAVAGGKSYIGNNNSSSNIPQINHPSRARFKLVAAVPRNLRNRAIPSPPSSSTSQLNTNTNNSNNPPALESIEDAEVSDDAQEATWRASGSHLKLHWMSAPATVLVVYKPTEEVLIATAEVIAWLMNRGLKVYVEPAVYNEVKEAVSTAVLELNKNNDSSNGGDGNTINTSNTSNTTNNSILSNQRDNDTVFGTSSPRTTSCDLAATIAETTRASIAHSTTSTSSLISKLLHTWDPNNCSCNEWIPIEIGNVLDLVLTLGGDGTVLWACSLFGLSSVPPIVPLAMGSLGFMTPFPLSRMDAVLHRVTSVAHGFPLMLRHRLQCRILRAGDASTIDLNTLNKATPCGEDVLVLNEVVIDRGMTASLANLQCYVDHNFVTTIQGDGLIVSTPTGSTAYNLAAGGSMVHPSVPCILFTPICPHTLSSRPLVFPEHVTLRVKVPQNSRAEAYCSFDGKGRQALYPGDSVLIHLSQWPVPMVCNLDSSHDWFLAVREGLHWNRRQVQKPL